MLTLQSMSCVKPFINLRKVAYLAQWSVIRFWSIPFGTWMYPVEHTYSSVCTASHNSLHNHLSELPSAGSSGFAESCPLSMHSEAKCFIVFYHCVIYAKLYNL